MGVAQRIDTGGWSRAGVSPVCALQVFGMRRSGNHAIIDWLMRNAPNDASGGAFLNNCRWGTDPLRSFAAVDAYDTQGARVPGGGKAAFAAAGARPHLIVSYEDRAPLAADVPQRAAKGYADTDFSQSIVILRSFLNWSASLLAKLKRNPAYGSVERARVMLNALPTYAEMLTRADDPGRVAICYDDWVRDPQARADILSSLHLPLRDNDLGATQRFGGGSSFDGSATSTTDRDSVMAHDPEYQTLLWTAAHDVGFVETLMPRFALDAERLVKLAETATLDISLTPREAS